MGVSTCPGAATLGQQEGRHPPAASGHPPSRAQVHARKASRAPRPPPPAQGSRAARRRRSAAGRQPAGWCEQATVPPPCEHNPLAPHLHEAVVVLQKAADAAHQRMAQAQVGGHGGAPAGRRQQWWRAGQGAGCGLGATRRQGRGGTTPARRPGPSNPQPSRGAQRTAGPARGARGAALAQSAPTPPSFLPPQQAAHRRSSTRCLRRSSSRGGSALSSVWLTKKGSARDTALTTCKTRAEADGSGAHAQPHASACACVADACTQATSCARACARACTGPARLTCLDVGGRDLQGTGLQLGVGVLAQPQRAAHRHHILAAGGQGGRDRAGQPGQHGRLVGAAAKRQVRQRRLPHCKRRPAFCARQGSTGRRTCAGAPPWPQSRAAAAGPQ